MECQSVQLCEDEIMCNIVQPRELRLCYFIARRSSDYNPPYKKDISKAP
jgi:hypothetical protein